MMQRSFAFSVAHAIANSITKNFAWFFFFATDCVRMQKTLIKLGTQETERILLLKFYAASPFFTKSDDHFPNHYERLRGEMAIAVRPAAVTVDDILAPADEMEKEHFKIGGTTKQRLTQVSERDGGEVRLHGKLFAQWLYYVFLRCVPFATTLAPCPNFRR